MNELDLIRYKKAIPLLKQIDEVLLNEFELFGSLISEYQEKIDSYNEENLTIFDPTKKELGNVISSIKKRIIHTYTNLHIYKNLEGRPEDDFSTEGEEWSSRNWVKYQEHLKSREVWHKIVDGTNFSKELVNAKILLIRVYGGFGSWNPLQRELNEHVLISMTQEFYEQNKEFIIKNT